MMTVLMWVVGLLCVSVRALGPTPFEKTKTVSATAVMRTATRDSTEFLGSLSTNSNAAGRVGLSVSPLITIAPVTANLIEQRQECFNDQGFRVDCATWTGYYYTWGPPGNPYEGGAGQGGGGGTGGESTVVVAASAATPLVSMWLQVLACCFGFLPVLLQV